MRNQNTNILIEAELKNKYKEKKILPQELKEIIIKNKEVSDRQANLLYITFHQIYQVKRKKMCYHMDLRTLYHTDQTEMEK